MLVMAAIDANAANELVTEAQAEGIKVITYDRGVSTAPTDYHISRNNYDAGKLRPRPRSRSFRPGITPSFEAIHPRSPKSTCRGPTTSCSRTNRASTSSMTR